MKKLRIFLYSIVLSIVCICVLNSTYNKKIHDNYLQEMGNALELQKNQGLALQNEGIKKGNNLFMFGSSELSSTGHPFHPIEFFKDENRGFQINLIGTGHCQSLIHAINLGALGSQLKGQKVTFIVSPQWFDATGETKDGFQGNFSSIQFLQFMFNDKVDKSVKMEVAKRVLELTEDNKMFYDIDMYCRLYIKDNVISKPILTTLMPYYYSKYQILSLKDKVKSIKVMEDRAKQHSKAKQIPKKPVEKLGNVDWEKTKSDANSYATDKANNNEFSIDNDYYNKYIKNRVGKLKDTYYKNISYTESPEYNDLKLLLEVCKSQGIDPLIISVPVNGKWYDYGGFDKKNREEYYNKLNKIVSSYDYPFADFSKYEYEEFFLKDIMHLGWKGWVYVDEAIDKHYNSNQ